MVQGPNAVGSITHKFLLKGNSGLGKETVLQLAKHNPKAIILCCRTLPKGQEALKDIKNVASDVNVEVLQLDLASFKSIEKASREFTLKHDRLDVLINNAGLVCHILQRSLARWLGFTTDRFADGCSTHKNSRGI